MTELYLQLLDRVLTPILLILAIFLLLRGHNLPGGGFIAALMAATAFELQILSRGEKPVRDAVGPYLHSSSGLGLLLAAGAAALGLLDHNFFTGIWFYIPLGPLGELELGTPVIFDLGVFLVVVSVTTSYLLGLSSVAEGGQP
jgi:multisubunit Na+/H+ antiporter MnhB subunit